MIETTQETTIAPIAPQDGAPNELDLLLVSAMHGLFDIGRLMLESVDKVPESQRGTFTQALNVLHDVLGTLGAAIGESRGLPPIIPPVAVGEVKPDNDPMEARITALETDMRDVRDRLVHVEVKLDGLDGRVIALDKKVDGLPSKDFVRSEVASSANKIIVWVVVAVGTAQLIPSLVLPLLKHFGI